MDRTTADIVIVGGGLAGSIAAYFFTSLRPDKKVILVESGSTLGGHHTWSFHEGDISSTAMELLRPMVTKSWTEHSVKFPRVQKTLPGSYHSIRSEDFDREMRDRLGSAVKLKSKAIKVTDSLVAIENGGMIEAPCVIDARGLESLPTTALTGFQKFIGYDFTLEEPHGLNGPLIMDATWPQLDGFRFFYLLPWDEKRVLVEETFYSDKPDLNEERINRSIRAYVERQGWKVKSMDREERGVLPIPLTSDYITTGVTGEPLPIGMRGGYFHATTGFSLPDAVRVAEILVKEPNKGNPELTTSWLRDQLVRGRRGWLSRQRFYRLLNRLLFQASEPGLRYSILQRFYELPQDLVERFYAGRTTWADRVRILSGKPPVPISRALKHFSERSAERTGG